MAKSTPMLVDKKEKQDNIYSLVYAYFGKQANYNHSIKEKILKLGNKDFFIQQDKSVLQLFGKVYGNGYVLITKHIEAHTSLNNCISAFFLKVVLFFILSTLGFFYFLYMASCSKKITEQEKREYAYLKKDTQKLAFEDALTKAATRLKFSDILKGLMDIAARFKQNYFSVIMFDIDNFKSINDTYGHDYGDHVLKTISSVVKENIRSSDTFARWGGEEFVILSPMSNLEQAVLLADKIREKIAITKFSKISQVTCSFGVVMYDKDNDEEEIMKRVDKLLYEAKRSGKNRVES